MEYQNNYDVEKFLRNINTVKFIQEVEVRPCLWNVHHESYNNRPLKQVLWTEVVQSICEDFHELSAADQTEMVSGILKKWKGLRNSFSREMAKRKRTSQATWKTYVYFDQLSFLTQSGWLRTPVKETPTDEDIQEWKNFIPKEELTEEFEIESKATIETVYMSDTETILKDPFRETNSIELPLTEFKSNDCKRPKLEIETSESEAPSSSTINQESSHPLLVFFSGLLPDYDKLTPKHQRLFKQNALTYLNELLDKQESSDSLQTASYHDL